MENNASCSTSCCSGKWCCPSFIGVVAGLIMIAAGSAKMIMGADMLSAVGGMALSGLHIDLAAGTLTLTLGWIAAIIEVVGGLSILVGCCKTSRWAGLFLSLIMGLAILSKLRNFSAPEGNLWMQAVALLQSIQIDLLLFAVFFTKAWKLIRNWCGCGCKDGACAVPMKK